MTATNEPADPAPAWAEAQFGPHRFYAGEGGGSAELRGARFEAADLRGARFTDCDLTGVTIRDGWLDHLRAHRAEGHDLVSRWTAHLRTAPETGPS